ncbi:hypothetical protein MSCUN_12680 [Methanosphaera cuniculi]|uniref:Uncharacterized protein n=1 Tax=Methanosphaera cuniculi TaxID=1077256 RepID=A0A2V2BUU3_9EURY|nr:hypothetical protein MSCUN_12680 [Methanosphaera cuniculi]
MLCLCDGYKEVIQTIQVDQRNNNPRTITIKLEKEE